MGKAGVRIGLGRKKAQEFADKLNMVRLPGNCCIRFSLTVDQALDDKDLPKEKRTQYMSYLRRLCCMFDILPSSFMLTPTFDGHGVTPFATGGFSDVYEATLDGRRVAVKVLKVNTQTIKSVRRVSGPLPPPLKAPLTPSYKLLIKEVVGWKWIRHENILPFVGVLSKPPLFSIISERMENGNIMNFIQARPDYNRLRLVSARRA